MKQILFVLAVAGLALWIPALHGDDPAKPQPKPQREKLDTTKVKALMHRKLENAQRILAAISLNDLDQTAKNAQDLIEVSKALEFKVFKTPAYDMYSEDFRRSASTLAKLAKDKNLEGAKLTYLEMTLSCFHCHAYVRDIGMIRLDDEAAR